LVVALACWSALWPAASPAGAEPGSLVDCARADAQRNFASVSEYRCNVASHRKVWKTDGTLHKTNVLHKTLVVRPPDFREETFVSGTINGKPAKEKEFIWERLGFDRGMDVTDIECLRPGMEGKFELTEKPGRVLAFKTLAPSETQLQTGTIQLADGSCRVTKLAGVLVHRSLVKNEVEFEADFTHATKSVWLASAIHIRGEVKLGPIKRRIDAKNEYSDFDVIRATTPPPSIGQ
jgi:hypothetical protein